MVYRFRVTYEDHEDVYRDIEIKASQSFLELHSAIQQAIDFDNSKPASFYTSDDQWRKEDEIASVNTGNAKGTKSKSKKLAGATFQAKKQTIADHVNYPHQKFMYLFDPEKEWTFLIELIKIVPADVTAPYPRCLKSVGASPKQYKPTTLPPPVEEDDEPKKTTEKEDHAPLIHAKDPLDEAAHGFIPLDEDGVEESGDKEEKEPGMDADEASSEDEEGESSDGFEFDDDDDDLIR